jgi:hypothetical protein
MVRKFPFGQDNVMARGQGNAMARSGRQEARWPAL